MSQSPASNNPMERQQMFAAMRAETEPYRARRDLPNVTSYYDVPYV